MRCLLPTAAEFIDGDQFFDFDLYERDQQKKAIPENGPASVEITSQCKFAASSMEAQH